MRPTLRALRLPFRQALVLAGYAFVSGLGAAASLVLLIEVGLRITDADTGAAVLGLDLQGFDLPALFGGAIAAAAVVLIVDLLAARQSARIIRTVQIRLRRALFDAYNDASWVTQAADPPGHLQDVMATNVARALNLTTSINSGLVALLSLVTLVAVAALISPLATALLLLALGALIGVLTPLAQRIRDAAETMRSTNLDHAVHLAEVAGVPTEIRTFGVGDAARERHGDSVEAVARAHGRLTWLERAVPSLQRNLALIAVLVVLAALHNADLAGVGELSAVVVLLGRSLTYANAAQQTLNKFAAAGPFVLALDDEIRRYEATADEPAGRDETVPLDADVVLDDVAYVHPGADQPTLDDVGLHIEAGTYLAVVGPSGAGKTTLAELLLGLRTPTTGRCTVGGVAVAELPAADRAGVIAFVPQRPTLIQGTLAANVRFLRTGIDDARVNEALAGAGLLDASGAPPAELGAELGPKTRQLSGGQLQRLAIARALAGQPAVIVLDEPTSALDHDAEAAISDTLHRLAGSVTLIVIAHRAATIEGCDRVLVLDQGRVVADGSPQDVAAHSDFWQRGFGAQPEVLA